MHACIHEGIRIFPGCVYSYLHTYYTFARTGKKIFDSHQQLLCSTITEDTPASYSLSHILPKGSLQSNQKNSEDQPLPGIIQASAEHIF